MGLIFTGGSLLCIMNLALRQVRNDTISEDGGRFCCLLVPNGNAFSYDGSGNLTNDGTWSYTWRQGWQLATMTDGYYTWNYTHDANGMRLKCTIGTDTSSSVAATAFAVAAIFILDEKSWLCYNSTNERKWRCIPCTSP